MINMAEQGKYSAEKYPKFNFKNRRASDIL